MTSRGTALIVVNRDFLGEPKLCRKGATKEFKRMCWMFGELGFDLVPFFNLTSAGIKKEFEKAIKKQCDCFVFVIATHGAETENDDRRTNEHVIEQILLGSDCQYVSIAELLKSTDNETIRKKTKLCFIQACRSIDTQTTDPAFSPNDLGVTVSVSSPIVTSQKRNETDKRDTLGSNNCDTTDSAVKNTWSDKGVEAVLNSEDFNIGDMACRSIDTLTTDPAFSPIDLGVTVSVCSPIVTSQKRNETDKRDTLGSNNCDTTDSVVKNTWSDKVVEAVLNSEDFNIGDTELQVATAPSELNKTEQINEYANPFDLPDSDNEEEAEDQRDPGSGDSNALPPLPLPAVIPVDCPPNCLIMFPVQQHNNAHRSPNKGSLMLHYMFEQRGELKNNDGNILPFLTSVLQKLSEYDSVQTIGQGKYAMKQRYKMCGTIYHRLTKDVCLQPGVQYNKQFRVWCAKKWGQVKHICREMKNEKKKPKAFDAIELK